MKRYLILFPVDIILDINKRQRDPFTSVIDRCIPIL